MDKHRIKSLDILRGTAILMVFLNHIEPRISPAVSELTGMTGFVFWRIKQLGWTGVDLFFVISGFLISGLLFSELEKSGKLNWRHFWIRRAFKIWPSYLLLLIVLAVTGATGYIDYTTPLSALESLATHLLFLQNYIPSGNPNGPTWSLAIEEHFYILLPMTLSFLVILSAKRSLTWGGVIPWLTLLVVITCLVLRIVTLNGTLLDDDYSRTHLRIDALMIGVYLNFLIRTRSPLITWIDSHRLVSFLAAVALIIPAAFFNRTNPFMFTIGFPLLSIGFSILLTLIYHGAIKSIEANFIMTGVARVGLWSYNIYLWHFFIILLPIPYYRMINQMLGDNIQSTGLQIAAQASLFIATSILLGAIMTILVENPFLKLRHRFFPSESNVIVQSRSTL
ncbi:acyltransferase [uncultured Thiodictyon sp.]|jgi:peptidoglycan/LPS O-acetylase OafA/YrhL|uniref:acyltransferase family protein n=1 Tax=uncultured Thiodictyon sp. TaxID=1846217 RepID=UPI00260009FF|nr:acyltransferase [uncultured Thiodictyon sp.]